MRFKTSLIILLFLLPITAVTVAAQDQLQMPSWELGWDEDMDGTHTLEVVNGDDINDELFIFIDNQRMSDLNIELTIEWDSSDIPIDLDYPESITISGSTNETISIMLKNENGYVYERSPNSSMLISVTADEISFEQSTSNQNIEADIAVPEVYDLVVGATSRGEKLFAGSFIEYATIKTTINSVKETNGSEFDSVSSEVSESDCESSSLSEFESSTELSTAVTSISITILLVSLFPEESIERVTSQVLSGWAVEAVNFNLVWKF